MELMAVRLAPKLQALTVLPCSFYLQERMGSGTQSPKLQFIKRVESMRRKRKKGQQNSWFVYGIESREAMKIGYSKNPSKRMEQLQTASPHQLELKFSIKARTLSQAKFVEKYLHERLRHYRLNGEWFELGVTENVVFRILKEDPQICGIRGLVFN